MSIRQFIKSLEGKTLDFKQDLPKIRNTVITRIFRELGLIEQWGSGMRRILKEAEELELPEMQIIEIGMRLRFIVPLTEQIAVKPKPNKLAPSQDQVAGEVTGKVGKLLSVMTGEMKRTKLQSALGLKHEDHFRGAYLKPVIKGDFIEMTIPDKPCSSKQKYRLTEKGKRVLAGNKEGADNI